MQWSEIAKGNHIYEIGDQGGFIVMAPYMAKTNYLMYSWDEGKSWENLTISKEKEIMVKNIVMEPLNQDTVFYVHGNYFDESKKSYKGIVVKVDFTKFHPRFCLNYEDPK